METLLKDLEEILLGLPEGYANAFKYYIYKDPQAISSEDFKRQINANIEENFYKFYNWLIASKFTGNPDELLQDEVKLDYLYDTDYTISSLKSIVDVTSEWNELIKDSSAGEYPWQEGFVALNSYGSYMQVFIDTLGKVDGRPGTIWEFDFKGGDSYSLKYLNIESWIKVLIGLLESGYFFDDLDYSLADVRVNVGNILQKKVNSGTKTIDFETKEVYEEKYEQVNLDKSFSEVEDLLNKEKAGNEVGAKVRGIFDEYYFSPEDIDIKVTALLDKYPNALNTKAFMYELVYKYSAFKEYEKAIQLGEKLLTLPGGNPSTDESIKGKIELARKNLNQNEKL